jgi:hypothetical protein
MPQYAVLLFSEAPADAADLTEEEKAAHERHIDDVARLGGRMVAAFALEPSTTATGIRGDALTDGPFLDAKEVVAGFYVLDAPDLDTALAIARLNPATRTASGGVEVRPVAGGFVAPTA